MYNFLKFLHIASVAVWMGGTVTLVVLNLRIAGSGDSALTGAFGKQAGAMSGVLFGPSALLAVITGIGMVQVANYSFGAKWISWGFAGFIFSLLLGAVLTAGTARKLSREIAAGPVDPARVKSVQRRILLYALLNIAVLLSVVWAMVEKPV